MNATLRQFAQSNPDAVLDGFLLVIGYANSWDSETVPWALFRDEADARQMAAGITEAQLLVGKGDFELEAGDEVVIELVEFKRGMRYDVAELRRVEVTAAGLRQYAASLPRLASLTD
jgi:hypothetical protein